MLFTFLKNVPFISILFFSKLKLVIANLDHILEYDLNYATVKVKHDQICKNDINHTKFCLLLMVIAQNLL